ncbi:retention module-containing protein [Kushneria sp. Sum13]|uniref:retention module-containing protein n=1 Tax=Kushneria sp. Sum13 TaxID=3459196 RepID=UPI004045A661
MAAYTVARVDGVVWLLDPRTPVIQGMALPENAVLVAADGGRIILSDGNALSLSAGQPVTLVSTGNIPELVAQQPAGVDPEIAALQAAIAAGQDPTQVQQAPAAGAGAASDAGGGDASQGGGFSQPFDVDRSGRQQQTEYRYSASFEDAGTTPSTFNGFANSAETDNAATAPVDSGDTATPATPAPDSNTTTPDEPPTPTDSADGSDTTTPTDPTDGGGTTTPVDPTDGDGTTTPTDPTDDDGTTIPVDPTDGTTTPTDPTDGGGTTTPVDPTDGDGTTTPTDPADGGGTTTPVDPTDGDGTTTPTDPTDGGGTTTPVDPTDGDGTTTPTDPTDGDGTTTPVDPTDGTTTPTDPTDGGGTTTPVDPTDGGDTTTPSRTPIITVALDAIAIDDIVNQTESRGDVALTGWGGEDATAGDAITVTIGEATYSTTLDDNLSFSISVPGSLLINNPSATVTLTHEEGNVSVTASSTRSYSVDLDAPSPTIQLDPIAVDDIVSAEESRQPIELTGVVGGDAAVGDRITILVGEAQFTSTVDQDFRFNVAVPGSALTAAQSSSVIAVISHTDAAGNVGSATTSREYVVDANPPALSIALDAIAGDNIVNADEAGQSIPVTGAVSGEFAAGDTVTLTVGDQSYTGVVNAGGTFSINVPGSQLAANNSVQANVSHTDAAGNIGSANTAASYSVDTAAPIVTISLDTIAGDDVVNATEAGQDVAITGRAGGDAVAGDTVTVSVGGQSYTTTVGQNGSFSVAVPGSVLAAAGTSTVSASVSHTDAAGNAGSADTTRDYTVDTTPPALSITLDTMAGDNIVNAEESGLDIPVTGSVSGEFVAGDTVTLTVGNQTYTGAVNADGTFSINVPGSQLAQNSSISAAVSHTDVAGNIGSANTAASYSVDTAAPVVTISLDTIAGDDVVNATEADQDVAITGQAGGDAVAGDTVTVSVGGQSYTTIVGQNGAFNVAVPGSVLAAAGTNTVSASVSHVDAAGNTGSADTSRDYAVDTTPPALSITLDTIAGDNIVNADESGQTSR